MTDIHSLIVDRMLRMEIKHNVLTFYSKMSAWGRK